MSLKGSRPILIFSEIPLEPMFMTIGEVAKRIHDKSAWFYIYIYTEKFYSAEHTWNVINSFMPRNPTTNQYYEVIVMTKEKRLGDLDLPHTEFLNRYEMIMKKYPEFCF